MQIALIGGVERNEIDYQRIAEQAGHQLEFHGGWVGGRGSEALDRLLHRADLVIIVTDVNSHGAVLHARRVVRQLGLPLLLTRRCGTARFAALLAEWSAQNRSQRPLRSRGAS